MASFMKLLSRRSRGAASETSERSKANAKLKPSSQKSVMTSASDQKSDVSSRIPISKPYAHLAYPKTPPASEGFPDSHSGRDIANTLSVSKILADSPDSLTDFERTEILAFPSIYYFADGVKKIKGDPARPNNCGYDTADGRYRCVPLDHLKYRYELAEELGQGTFGCVVKCFDHKNKDYVAVKVALSDPVAREQCEIEIRTLELIKGKQRKRDIKLPVPEVLDHFVFRNHLCIVYELLAEDLESLVSSGTLFDETMIATIASDIVETLRTLKRLDIVHCDIKPSNIAFNSRTSNHVTLIDYGSSCFASEEYYGEAQTLNYRAPEVILGCGFGTAVDMWSLGCVLAELYTGCPLFPGLGEQDVLMYQMEMFGLPPKFMLETGARVTEFFDKNNLPRHINDEEGQAHLPGSTRIGDFLGPEASRDFVDFVERCLQTDINSRLTPGEAAAHPFIRSRVQVQDARSVRSIPNSACRDNTEPRRSIFEVEENTDSASIVPSSIAVDSPAVSLFVKQRVTDNATQTDSAVSARDLVAPFESEA